MSEVFKATKPNGRQIPRPGEAWSIFGRVVVSNRDPNLSRFLLLGRETIVYRIQIEGSDIKREIIRNQAPEGEISTMVVVKFSDKAEGSRDNIDDPSCI